jgi:hypothetical protein
MGSGPEPGLDHEGHTEGGATPPGPVQPGSDRTPGSGTFCFFTGQGSDSTNVSDADVDAGKTSLTTPALDLTGLADPVISFWQWFYSEFGAPEDWLAVMISNDDGASWTPVDTTRALRGPWVERALRVADYLTPTAQVRLRFVAADLGVESVVEAAIDDLALYDGPPETVSAPASTPRRLAFRRPAPNPSTGAVRLSLELPVAGPLRVEVLDVTGRRVRVLHQGPAGPGTLHLSWDGAGDGGAPTPAGCYFVRAMAERERAETRIARIR